MTCLFTESGPVAVAVIDGHRVHRVGYASGPWMWTPWQYAEDGRFTGRWDDPDGHWRALYAADTRLACYLECLAPFRPDPHVAEQLAGITVDDPDDELTLPGGTVPADWRRARRIGTGYLTGCYVVPADKESLPTLRDRFGALAALHRLPDVDAATIRLARPRAFTQAIAGWLYPLTGPGGEPISGVRFESRHGDDLVLWAIFERPGDNSGSCRIDNATSQPIFVNDQDLQEAMRIHRLRWDKDVSSETGTRGETGWSGGASVSRPSPL